MKTHTGFTLIEVLIAMLILAVGLLGLAALQTYTLRSNLAAYNHGQAVQLLYDMADRMRANNCKDIAATLTAPALTCNTLPIPNYAIVDTLNDDKSRIGNLKVGDVACMTAGNTTCNATLLSTYDLIEWSNALANALPMGRGCIISAGGGIFTLYITWDDDRNGVVNTDVAIPVGCANTFTTPSATTSTDPIFSMGVQL